ncbi:hypothetical protein B0H14DRAFT_3499782 [Mycena olivaceomarginata]|nr:hypothetical protein B0H14DRAFT_3499782 [Mycena olivaceomarginata]
MSVNDARDPFSPSSDLGHPADVILRSSDLVDFYTHKTILSFASPVFADMFTCLNPSAKRIRPETEGPCDGFRDLDGVDGAYEAAGKYDIQGGQKLLEQLLTKPRFREKEPHRVFAIACRWRLEDLAKTAAMEDP